ncbi:MAG: hypothetical protein D6785_14600 [Planctomycetota bacterium]|nr:MAG: hypothetical protein D6785_14600 [Planctomycetota bacterium]
MRNFPFQCIQGFLLKNLPIIEVAPITFEDNKKKEKRENTFSSLSNGHNYYYNDSLKKKNTFS